MKRRHATLSGLLLAAAAIVIASPRIAAQPYPVTALGQPFIVENKPGAGGVRTVAESGLPGYEVIQWHGLIGPKGLPRPIVDRVNHDVSAVLNVKETGEQLQNDGVSPAGGTPEQFLATIKKEVAE